ncbi:F-box protein At3g07870-like [Papaver somniferum]|uniref:F-box protein At3g07870-like n=1 Tax=Papaver somniferum TaxID=3469 RepID=UPI000E6F8DD4|nr:F-box protein At3g07870-like [Papaver somniferum]
MDSKVRLYYGETYNEELIEDAEQYSYEALAKIDLSLMINHSYVGSFILRPYMVGSCNGLVCFNVYHHDICDPVYICNPLTGECTHLPKIERRDASPIAKNIVFAGFGYSQSTNEYKVIRIYYDEKSQVTGSSKSVGKVQVYTLGGRSRTIVAFDLKDEKFRKIPSPLLNIPDEDFRIAGLRLLGGNLCVYHTDECKFVDIWTIQKGNSRSIWTLHKENNRWNKEFSIILENSNVDWPVCYPLAFLNRNELLLRYNGNLYLYDLTTSTLKKIWEDVSNKTAIESIPHMHSLVSPEALGPLNRGAYSSLPHWLRSSWIIFFPISVVLLTLLY